MKYTHEDYLKLSDGELLHAHRLAWGWPTLLEHAVVSITTALKEEKGHKGEGWSTFYAELDKYIDELKQNTTTSPVNHPAHYGGQDNPYEAIKVIEAWGLGFNLGNVVKYLSRAGKKGNTLEDLRKAAWYLQREIQNRENE
jgi:hypothetical protein